MTFIFEGRGPQKQGFQVYIHVYTIITIYHIIGDGHQPNTQGFIYPFSGISS